MDICGAVWDGPCPKNLSIITDDHICALEPHPDDIFHQCVCTEFI